MRGGQRLQRCGELGVVVQVIKRQRRHTPARYRPAPTGVVDVQAASASGNEPSSCSTYFPIGPVHTTSHATAVLSGR